MEFFVNHIILINYNYRQKQLPIKEVGRLKKQQLILNLKVYLSSFIFHIKPEAFSIWKSLYGKQK